MVTDIAGAVGGRSKASARSVGRAPSLAECPQSKCCKTATPASQSVAVMPHHICWNINEITQFWRRLAIQTAGKPRAAPMRANVFKKRGCHNLPSRTRARHLPGQRRDLLHRGRVSRAAGGLVLRWSPLISQGDSPLADAYPQTNPHSRIGVRLVAAPATRSGAPSGREHDDAGSLPDRP